MPKITVLMPVYNSKEFLCEAIESILSQTFEDFEFIIVNEFGSHRDCEAIIRKYQQNDQRILLVQNDEKLGLAESLNKGILLAKGEYIARMDADDISLPERLEKQVNFLDRNKDISLCGSWQEHFGLYSHIHRASETPQELKAIFLFACDMCHSTIMFRKKDFVGNNFFYDSSKLAEDYELWTRASAKLKFYNIQEVLGKYRHSNNNITTLKTTDLNNESAEIAASLLKDLDIHIVPDDMILLGGWINPYWGNNTDVKLLLKRKKKLLDKIATQNKKIKVYEQSALLNALGKRWLWANGIPFDIAYDGANKDTNYYRILKKGAVKFTMNKLSFKEKCKLLIKRVLRPIYRKVMDRFLFEFEKNIFNKFNNEIRNGVQLVTNEILNTSKMLEISSNSNFENIKNDLWTASDLIEGNISNRTEDIKGELWKAKESVISDVKSFIREEIREMSIAQLIRISGINKSTKKIFLFGVPYHQNMGDQAQTYCIKNWCSHNYPDYMIYEIKSTWDDKFNYYPVLLLIREKLAKSDKIFVHSGYHTTDMYFNEQALTLAVLKVFNENQVVIFPQTVFFKDKTKMDYVFELHNAHNNLIFMARDFISYKTAKKKLTSLNVIAFPDIVTTLIGKYDFSSVIREGILFCLRGAGDEIFFDAEKMKKYIIEVSKRHSLIEITDTETEAIVDEVEADRISNLMKIINRYSKYKIVITDRYHGIIFALIAATPVIVLKSADHKLSSGVDWFKDLDEFEDYIHYCDSFKAIDDAINTILNLKLKYRLPSHFAENYYDKLKNIIEG